MNQILPPDQIQLSSFLPTQNLITKFYNLFLAVLGLQKMVTINQIADNPADGSTVTARQSDDDLWLEIVLSAGIAALDIRLPVYDIPRDGQVVSVTSTQVITTSFFIATGSAIIGAPTTIGPTTPTKFAYSKTSNAWYRQ